MKENYYSIGEVSRITGISKDTLHFYSKTGLLVPDYIDPDNRYRYYSKQNLWQLDIIAVCRKLSIPLDKVKEILSLRDNRKILALMQEHREEALRLSAYYSQVAEDISWYDLEYQNILSNKDNQQIRRVEMDEQTVLVGVEKRDTESYHADLQEVAHNVLREAPSIRRKYGYILDARALSDNRFKKRKEYLHLPMAQYDSIPEENRYTIPAGEYVVFTAHIQNECVNTERLYQWLEENSCEVDLIFAEELGMQLFPYIDDYYCEIKAHIKNNGKVLTV